MNIYVVVEGATEKSVYANWIPLVNPNLRYVNHPTEVSVNNFCIVSSMGYPYCFHVIDAAIEDANAMRIFDRLVILLDSEDASRDEKEAEIASYMAPKYCSATVLIAIQHFCFETWALANRRLIDPKPTSGELRAYKTAFDVRTCDPELLPAYPRREWNRSQFAERYLIAAVQEKNARLTYDKARRTSFIAHPKYFDQVKRRHIETNHIPSFASFIHAFS